ncbi:hypothetical protein DLAC_04930 [Tieghemostelium lacteum]|uniref:Uncharacterized protein n=1 Tax=Tieghemostelium lacteum TaxID=361077 RepID=A0A151ZI58_TIELA|nr:hypothetical protein DLAC_04930 [Tieghemostelium lacteum]|eukprot:KYQ93560.1 hypothetical protein DLAC_04930 [Tieghemostelium lacteum]
MPQYISIIINLQCGFQLGSEDEFWKSFGILLKKHFPTREVSIQNASDFVFFFSKHLWTKPVVLFIDEYDLLFLSDEIVYSNILRTFRGIKQSQFTAIHSMVVISCKCSTFNVSSRLKVPYFSEKQVLELFGMYSADRPYLNPLLIQEIAKDIYRKTNGHPGHTVLCGKLINDKLVSIKGGGLNNLGDLPIYLNIWKDYYSSSFWNDAMSRFQTLKVMGSLLFNNRANSPLDSHIMMIIDFLIKYAFVSSGFSIPPSIINDFEYLLEEGIIDEDRKDLQFNVRYTFTSDFVRNYMMIIFKNNVSKLVPLDITSTFIPAKNGYLNMYDVISTTFNRFLPKAMIKLSYTSFFKKNKSSGSMVYRDHFVPQEYSYHF